ncbi:MAG TPA: TolC family protein, partial [Opitutaceae bacterium]
MPIRRPAALIFALLAASPLSRAEDPAYIPPSAPPAANHPEPAAEQNASAALQQNPLPAPAVLAPPAGPPLSLRECVARALQKNFDLRIQQFSTNTAKENVTIALAAFDPSLQLTASRFHQRSAVGTSYLDPNGNIVVGVPYSSDGDTTRFGVSQPLVTGTTISASADLGRNKSIPPSSLLDPVYNSDVSLTVKQPLLKNFGTRVNRAQIERAKLGVTIANLDFKSSVLTVIRNVETAYYNLAFAREQLAVRRFSLEVANALLEENKTRRTTGVVTDLEVLQAQVGVAKAQRALLLADQDLHNKEDALLALIEPFGFTKVPIGAIELPNDKVGAIDGDLSYKRARDNTPEYASSQTLIEQLKLDAVVARSNRLPQLDLAGTGGYSADRNSYSSAARHVWDGDGYNWEVDATLSFAWGQRADKAKYRQALYSLDREKVHLEQIEQNILVEVRSAVRAVQTNQEGVRISSLNTELSRREYDTEKARYEAGLSTFRRVQEAKADWDSATVDELQSRVDLRNAVSDLSRLEGSSLQ